MPVTWYPNRWWDLCMLENDKKEIIQCLFKSYKGFRR